jgi:hypothetical protein
MCSMLLRPASDAWAASMKTGHMANHWNFRSLRLVAEPLQDVGQDVIPHLDKARPVLSVGVERRLDIQQLALTLFVLDGVDATREHDRRGDEPGWFPSDLDTIGTFGYGHPRSLILLDALRIRVLAWKPA